MWDYFGVLFGISCDGGEGTAVVFGDAETLQSVLMRPGAVSGIGLPAIAGEGAGKVLHQTVPGDLGDDRGRGDRQRAGIALDDGLDRAGQVGRGPWAGPVVACAVVLHPERLPPGLAAALDDSKKLSAARREALFDPLIVSTDYGLAEASVQEIDRLNILQASMLAMRRAFDRLPEPAAAALVDGNRAPDLPCHVQTVVKGDSRSLSIAAASIIAKVTRDRLMRGLARAFPGYGWETNAGYGTAAHREGLERQGITEHHRRSFAPIARYTK